MRTILPFRVDSVRSFWIPSASVYFIYAMSFRFSRFVAICECIIVSANLLLLSPSAFCTAVFSVVSLNFGFASAVMS